MKKLFFVFAAAIAFTGLAHADQICGKLTGYCGNGWCNKSITPTYCLGANLPGTQPGAHCRDGAPVKVIPENDRALEQLNDLLDDGEGTPVCANGAKDDSGTFHVHSAIAE